MTTKVRQSTVQQDNISIDWLSDVDTTTSAATNGQALVYNTATSKWVPGTVAGGAPSNGGATTTSSAVDITLTSASNRLQIVSMTASDRNVVLPDATTLTTGGALYVIKNTGTITFIVRNASSSVQAVVAASHIVALYLSDNTTAAGVWAVGNQSTSSFLETTYSASTTAVTGYDANGTAICGMSATQAIVVYITNNNTIMRARTLNMSGSTMTLGDELNIGAGAYYVNVIAMSATQALVCSYDQTCYTLNISGTTITAGTGVNVGPGGARRGLAKASATQAVIVYSSSSNIALRTLNISSTTITAGSEMLTGNSVAGEMGVSMFSSTAGALVWAGGGSTYLRSTAFTISGNSIVMSNSVNNINNIDTDYITFNPLTSTTALVVYNASNSLRAAVIYFNGSTLSIGNELNTGITSASWVVSTVISPNKALVLFGQTSAFKSIVLTINGTTIAAGGVRNANAANGNYTSATSLSNAQSLFAFRNTSSTFTNVTVIETPS